MPHRKFDRSLIPPAPDYSFESLLWRRGLPRIAGIDEAGRGALAGPVAAAAVILPDGIEQQNLLDGVNDSKLLKATEREDLRARIEACAVAFGVGFASSAEIDRFGIIAATRLAMRRALLEIDPLPDHLLIDHVALPQVPIPQTSLVKGDQRCMSIAAASILAKTSRDAAMKDLARQFPGYQWTRNKGYGTAVHLDAIHRLGPSPVHRLSFAPLRSKPAD